MAAFDEFLNVLDEPQAEQQQSFQSPLQEAEEAAPEPVEENPADFFTQTSIPVQDATVYKPHRDRWWKTFGDRYRDQKFRDVAHYVDWVKNLRNESGQSVSVEAIGGHIRETALEYAPQHIKDEYKNHLAQKQEDAQQARIDARMKKWNSDPLSHKIGIVWGPDGKSHKVDPEKLSGKRKDIDILRDISTYNTLLDPVKGAGLSEEDKGVLNVMKARSMQELAGVGQEDLAAQLSEFGRGLLGQFGGGQQAVEPEATQQAQAVDFATPEEAVAAYYRNQVSREELEAIATEKGW